MQKSYNKKLGASAAINFLEFIRTAQKVQSENTLILTELNKKQQDLLHAIEIPDKLSKKDIAKIGSDIRKLRRERRVIKDDLSLAEIVMNVVKKNPSMVEDIESLIERLQSEEKFLEERNYNIKSNVINEVTSLDASKLKTSTNKMTLAISKIIKSWGVCTITNDGKSDVTFTLSNTTYTKGSACASFNNIKFLLTKEFPGIIIAIKISDFPITDNGESTLTCALNCQFPDGQKCSVCGSIIYPYKENTKQPHKKGGHKK